MIHIKKLFNKARSHKKTIALIAVPLVVIASIFIFNSVQQSRYIAEVNGQLIERSYHSDRLDERIHFLEQANQDFNPESISDQVLSNLIDETIMRTYASENSLLPSDAEIDNRYQAIVSRYDSENNLLDRLDELYGTDKAAYLLTIENDLIRETVAHSLNKPLHQWLQQQREAAEINIFE